MQHRFKVSTRFIKASGETTKRKITTVVADRFTADAAGLQFWTIETNGIWPFATDELRLVASFPDAADYIVEEIL
jgi:hypothetical protein